MKTSRKHRVGRDPLCRQVREGEGGGGRVQRWSLNKNKLDIPSRVVEATLYAFSSAHQMRTTNAVLVIASGLGVSFYVRLETIPDKLFSTSVNIPPTSALRREGKAQPRGKCAASRKIVGASHESVSRG